MANVNWITPMFADPAAASAAADPVCPAGSGVPTTLTPSTEYISVHLMLVPPLFTLLGFRPEVLYTISINSISIYAVWPLVMLPDHSPPSDHIFCDPISQQFVAWVH